MQRVALTLLLLVVAPDIGAAQDVVVMSLGGDAPTAIARQAREAVAAALTEDGLEVLPDADLGLRVSPARLAECQQTACAYAIGRELGVSMVAAVATWTADGEASSLTISLIVGPTRSHTATEEVTDAGLLAAARAAVTAAQSSRRRALIIEGSSSPVPHAETSSGFSTTSPGEEPPGQPSVLQAERSLEEWILPSLLGVVGLALVGTAVYAMLGESCDQFGSSGVCLRGTRPNYGLGVTFAIVGGLSIAGALLWLIVGGEPTPMEDIDVVFGRDGVGVRF